MSEKKKLQKQQQKQSIPLRNFAITLLLFLEGKKKLSLVHCIMLKCLLRVNIRKAKCKKPLIHF